MQQIVDDCISLIYCDFPMNGTKRAGRKEALAY